MDCYKILRVSEDASDEEIYKAYISLSSSYSASYNTSPYARRKLRDIEKAYTTIQNELKRKVYAKEEIKEVVREEVELFDYASYKENSDEVRYDYIPLKDISLFNDVYATWIDKEKEVRVIDVDYSYVVLRRKYKFEYKIKEECKHSIDSYSECTCCNTIGKVEYKNGVIYCPVCDSHGSMKIHNCEYCNDYGYVYKDVYDYIYFDEDIVVNGIDKGDVLYKFNFVNKDRVVEEKNHIYITYDLSYSECINGVNIKWDTFNGPIVINSSLEDVKKEYVFEGDKKIHIILNRVAYKGENISKYIFIKSNDIHKKIYVDMQTYLYKDIPVGNYNKELIFDGENSLVVPGYGMDGINGGDKGDLILTPIVTNHIVNLENIEEYSICRIDTSSRFNLFGGRIDGKFFGGLKGKNAAVVKDKTIYILSGKSKVKQPMYKYFWFSVLVYLLWVIMPLLLVLLPYTEADLIMASVFTAIYSLVANIILNLKG